jgi:Protein of unknown function (DUF551)
MQMELIESSPIARACSINTESETADSTWIQVSERMPEDREPVHVMLEKSREILTAWRGHYQSTGAWFDARTATPIYEKIVRWKP